MNASNSVRLIAVIVSIIIKMKREKQSKDRPLNQELEDTDEEPAGMPEGLDLSENSDQRAHLLHYFAKWVAK